VSRITLRLNRYPQEALQNGGISVDTTHIVTTHVCCHNDTLVYSNSRLPDCFKCLLNWKYYEPCYASSCCLLVLGSLGAFIMGRWAQWRLQNVKSRYQYAYWNVAAPELQELGAVLLKCWSIRIFAVSASCWKNCTLFWSSLRCTKIWTVICCRGLNFPRKQWFSLHKRVMLHAPV